MENPDEELICSVCDLPIKEEDEVCYKCGSDLSEFEDNTLANNKYPSLKNLSGTCRVLVILIFAVALISVYYGSTLLANDNLKSLGILIIVYSLFIGILSIVILLAISEGIIWLIDMENNSRVHSRLLYKLVKGKK